MLRIKRQIKRVQSIAKPMRRASKSLALLVQQKLEAAMGNIAKKQRAIMFSGGFDSILVSRIAQKCNARVTAVTVGFEDFNQMTVHGAVSSAREIGIEHHILDVKMAEFLSAFEAIAQLIEEPVLDLDLALVYAALKKYDSQTAGKVFISAMGSDQWFGNEALKSGAGDFTARLQAARLDETRHQTVAHVHGYQFVFPFLSKSVLNLSQEIPPRMKKDKALLRALALGNKTPDRGLRSEVQVPDAVRRLIIKIYGGRARPAAVSLDREHDPQMDQKLRQIILGLSRK